MTAHPAQRRPDAAKVLNALAQPLLIVDVQGMVIDVNAAAETFFDMGRGSAAALAAHGPHSVQFARFGARRRRAEQSCDRQWLQDRYFHAQDRQSKRCRCFRRALVADGRFRRDYAARTRNCRKNRQATDASQRRPLNKRARAHARARDQEPALRHSRRSPIARGERGRRGPGADAADLRGDRSDRQARRSDAIVRRFDAVSMGKPQHSRRFGSREALGPGRVSRATSALSRPTILRCPMCLDPAIS